METYVINQMTLKAQYRDAALELFNKPFNNDLSPNELNQVIAHVVKNKVIAPHMQRANTLYSEEKVAVYFSIEFLIGRIVHDALTNTGLMKVTRKVFEEEGVDIHKLEEVGDTALGNGGLGRLAACFIESAATIGYPLFGVGLYYKYGLFKQSFDENGRQIALPDDWAPNGDPWFEEDRNHTYLVNFQDTSVRAVPMVMPIIGYNESRSDFKGNAFPLVLWKAESIPGVTNESASKISDWLYPSDGNDDGKILRIRQEYFFVSAQMQMLFDIHKEKHGNLDNIEDYYCFQMNDTHPVFGVLEFIRLLQVEGYSFDVAFEKAKKCFAYTNHTILAEALEKWEVRLFKNLLPDLFKVIQDINQKLIDELRVQEKFMYSVWEDGRSVLKADWAKIREYELFDERKGIIYMANIACYMSFSINGVAEVHTDIIKKVVLRNWYELYPGKFNNKTNGVTPRRWVKLAHPTLANFLDKHLGSKSWTTDMALVEGLDQYKNDNGVLAEFAEVKRAAKVRLAAKIYANEGVEIDPDSIFDCQVKRIHMYKRQSMNILRILNIYARLKRGELPNFYKTTFIIGGKAADSYEMAKEVIACIKDIQNMINNDPDVNDKMKVVFLTNFGVSYGELVYAAADFSEQISMAGKEASGTGNMKFMMNGAVTIGTEDGANIEIFQEAGTKNNVKFGATVGEFNRIDAMYRHSEVLSRNRDLLEVLKYLKNTSLGLRHTYWDLVNMFETNDEYYAVYDLRSYIEASLAAIEAYAEEKRTGDMSKFTRKAFKNTAHSGKFSSDRTITQYAEEIWHIKRIA